MRCDFGGLCDLIQWLILTILSLVVGLTGLRQPGQVWYWFEWLYWKQTQWFLAIPPEKLKDPRESVKEGLAKYPEGAKLIQIICGCMTVLGAIFLIAWVAFLLEFIRNCL